MDSVKQTSPSEPVKKLSYGDLRDGLIELEYAVREGRPTISFTVSYFSEEQSRDLVASWIIREEYLADFCASLLNLTPIYASSRYNLLGGYMLAMPSQAMFLNDEDYTAHFLFFEDSTENLEKQNSYHKNEGLLLRDMSDSWNEIHNKSISTITISPSERAELTAFALRQLSNAWGVTVGDVLNILPKSFKAMSR